MRDHRKDAVPPVTLAPCWPMPMAQLGGFNARPGLWWGVLAGGRVGVARHQILTA